MSTQPKTLCIWALILFQAMFPREVFSLQFANPNWGQGFSGGNTREEKVKTVVLEALNIWKDAIADCGVSIKVQVNLVGPVSYAAEAKSTRFILKGGANLSSGLDKTLYPIPLAMFMDQKVFPDALGLFPYDLIININDAGVNLSANPQPGDLKFFLGLDHTAELSEHDLFFIVTHEIAHGLGFSEMSTDISNGNDYYINIDPITQDPTQTDFIGIFERNVMIENPATLGYYDLFTDDVTFRSNDAT